MSTGLNTDFTISPGGGFVLASGAPKAFNELWFLINYNLQRIYLEDFSPGFEGLDEKSGSYLIQNQTLILGSLLKLISKYISNISILGVNMMYGLADRKQYAIAITHQYVPDQTTSTAVAFIGG